MDEFILAPKLYTPDGYVSRSLSQREETGSQRESLPGASVVYVYQRSRDSAAEKDIGQDYLGYRYNSERLVFAVCDGVGGSFEGDFAARFLGQHLIEWFWSQERIPTLQSELSSILSERLSMWAELASKEVNQLPVKSSSAFLEEVMEELRGQGSQTVFLAGVLDLRTYQFAVCWLGNTRFILWGASQSINDEKAVFVDHQRWSTHHGIMNGPLHTEFGTLSHTSHLTIFTDGSNLQRSQLEEEGIEYLIDQCTSSFQSDDVTILDITPTELTAKALPSKSTEELDISQIQGDLQRQIALNAALDAEIASLHSRLLEQEPGTKRKEQHLESSLADLEQQKNELDKKLSSIQNSFQVREQYLHDSLTKLNEEKKALAQDKHNLEVQLDNLWKDISSGELATTLLHEKNQELQNQIDVLNESVSTLEYRKAEVERELSSIREELQYQQQLREQLQFDKAELEATISELNTYVEKAGNESAQRFSKQRTVLRFVGGYAGLASALLIIMLLLNRLNPVAAPLGPATLTPHSITEKPVVNTPITQSTSTDTHATENPREILEVAPTFTTTVEATIGTEAVPTGSPDYSGCGSEDRSDPRCISPDGMFWMYEVQKGDSVSTIAQRYGLEDYQVINEDNDLFNKSIQPGEILRIRIP